MDEIRLLKKYANRRLYDTHLKKYVSLEEIRDLIGSGTDVRIEDSKSGEYITRPILLQIMAECARFLGPASMHCRMTSYTSG